MENDDLRRLEVTSLLVEVFGSQGEAQRWSATPAAELGGATPDLRIAQGSDWLERVAVVLREMVAEAGAEA